MTISEKANILCTKYLSEWVKTRQQTEIELSDKQGMFCCCGKLATGLHEKNCRRFQSKVTTATVKKLEHLLKEG
jgi:hypothetical protein